MPNLLITDTLADVSPELAPPELAPMELSPVEFAPEESDQRRRRWAFLEPSSVVPTYIGIGVVAVGFVLIAIGWAKVAGLLNVALQVPYLVSAGLSGLALVMVGLLVVNVAAKRRDAAERTRQLEGLTTVLDELRRALTEGEGPR
ncbi:MAG: hypothetical protein ACYDAQ_19630 [Mycobacteriales bacterium]